MIGDLWQDLRHAIRLLRKKPAFTITAIVIMALGIGANTAIFSLIRAVLLRPLQFKEPDRLVMVWEDASFIGFPRNTPAPANYADWTARNETFEDMAARETRSFNLTGGSEPEKVQADAVTGSFFSILGIEPLLGRVITADDDKPEATKVAVLSHGFWQRRFGGDPELIGRDIILTDEKYTVIGVMPKGFQFFEPYIALWVPSAMSAEELAQRGNHYIEVVGRLKPGVTFEQANADIKAVMGQISSDFPDEAGNCGAYIVSLNDEIVGKSRRPLVVLLVAVAVVLLIASANLANLLLSRAIGRSKEIAVRTALGATRRRIVRQMLTESVVLSCAGGAAGVLVAVFSSAFLSNLIPPGLRLQADLSPDTTVLVFTMLLSTFTGVLFGFAPALQASRLDLNEALKQGGGRTSLSAGHRRLQNALVVGEVALAMIMLTGAGLLIRTFAQLRNQYAGLRAESVLTVRTALPQPKYEVAGKRVSFYERVLEGVKSLPGVTSAGFTTSVPLEWRG
jgi:predicted permease